MSEYLSTDERFVKKLHEIANARIGDEAFGISQLSEGLGMSRATLHRKLKRSLNKSASRFLNEIRLEKGKELLEHRTGTVAEIAYQVGFRNASYFNKCFREHYGYPPGEILKGKHASKDSKHSEDHSGRDLKSIAVLPLKNDGPSGKHDHVVDGLREEIINKLNLIGDIHVISRTSSDTYRYSSKNIKEIARELQVNYILEGSYQIYRSVTRIRLQLIRAATDFHLWSQPYECNLNDSNLFEIQKDVAFRVAGQLKVKITPEEKNSLKKSGTEHPSALTHYQKGIGYSMLARNEKRSGYWDHAIEEFGKAVNIDAGFAEAWLRMAETIVYNKMLPNRYLTGFLDLRAFNDTLVEVCSMLEKANVLGLQNPELALFVDSMYSATRDDFLDGLNKSILNQSDTSDFNYYRTIGYIAYFKCEYYHAIKYWLHFIRLINGKDTPSVDDFHFINSTMALAGFPEEGRKIADLALKQTGDRLWYHYAMLPITAGMGDGEHFNRLVMELHQEFPEDPVFANFTMNICVFNRDAEKSLLLLQKRIELMKKKNIPVDPNPYMAWVYQANEMDKEFRWHVERILLNRIGLEEDIVVPNAAFLFVHLAATFALTGQRDEMYACLDQILQRESALMDVISQLRRAPHFDRFRHEIKFDTLVTAIEKKYDSVKRRCQKLFQGENNIKFDLEYPRNTGKVIKGDEQKTGGRNNK